MRGEVRGEYRARVQDKWERRVPSSSNAPRSESNSPSDSYHDCVHDERGSSQKQTVIISHEWLVGATDGACSSPSGSDSRSRSSRHDPSSPTSPQGMVSSVPAPHGVSEHIEQFPASALAVELPMVKPEVRGANHWRGQPSVREMLTSFRNNLNRRANSGCSPNVLQHESGYVKTVVVAVNSWPDGQLQLFETT